MNKIEIANKLFEILEPVECNECPLNDVCSADGETNSICSELIERKKR